MVDTNEFFRNATLRICGRLDIEESLRDCLEYVARYLPADRLYLQQYEPGLGAMRMVARASASQGECMDLLVPLDQQARQELAGVVLDSSTGELPPVVVVNNPRTVSVTRCIQTHLGEPASSVMSMPLVVEGRVMGAVVVLARGDNRYNQEHARLYMSLMGPLFVAMSNALKHRETVRLKNRLTEDNRFLNSELLHLAGDEIVGSDLGLRDVMHKVRQVAPTGSPVLLSGETGVGKDVIANAIHLASPRRDGPFIAVNCGAIPEALIDSELFGHEKGAFTGALSRKRGRFERAEGGTILLDEIGEMPMAAQVRLLRVLQHREIERVGGTERVPLDIRVITATNRDLAALVKEGRFREDLWFRLNVFPIEVPPLRERPGDIPALVRRFVERKARDLKIDEMPKLAPGSIDDLFAYHWPGNVRELENLVERAMIVHRDGPLRFEDLGATVPRRSRSVAAEPPDDDLLELDAVIERHIRRALARTGGKIHGPGGAGELLGVNPNTLRHRMRKLGIPFGRNAVVPT